MFALRNVGFVCCCFLFVFGCGFVCVEIGVYVTFVDLVAVVVGILVAILCVLLLYASRGGVVFAGFLAFGRVGSGLLLFPSLLIVL